VGKVRIIVDKNRVDGSRVRLAEVEVGDETGTVSLRARDDQIDILQEIANRSGAVVLRNCMLELYQGKHIRLAVTKWGKISAYPDHVPSTPAAPRVINRDKNYSLINLNLVASDMTITQTKDQSGSQIQESDSISQSNYSGSSSRNFQSNNSRRERRPSRGSTVPGANVSLHSYSDTNVTNTMRQYPGQHGYSTGFVPDTMGVPQYYTPQRHQEPNTQQQQQIMFQHHQYEMQQRQMHLYHRGSPVASTQHTSQFASSMQIPTITGASNFESVSAIPYSPPLGSMPGLFHPRNTPSMHGAPAYQNQDVNRSQSPGSNRMNAYAATFDPNTGGGNLPSR
jgi:hypothetical protein